MSNSEMLSKIAKEEELFDNLLRDAILEEDSSVETKQQGDVLGWVQMLYPLVEYPPQFDLPDTFKKHCDSCNTDFNFALNYGRHMQKHDQKTKDEAGRMEKRNNLLDVWDKLDTVSTVNIVRMENLLLPEPLQILTAKEVVESASNYNEVFEKTTQTTVKLLLDAVCEGKLPSPKAFFFVLDRLSENTFLSGTLLPEMHKVVCKYTNQRDGSRAQNLPALLGYLVEYSVVKALEERAHHAGDLLIKDEEDEKKKQAALRLSPQRKLSKAQRERQKHQKIPEQATTNENPLTVYEESISHIVMQPPIPNDVNTEENPPTDEESIPHTVMPGSSHGQAGRERHGGAATSGSACGQAGRRHRRRAAMPRSSRGHAGWGHQHGADELQSGPSPQMSPEAGGSSSLEHGRDQLNMKTGGSSRIQHGADISNSENSPPMSTETGGPAVTTSDFVPQSQAPFTEVIGDQSLIRIGDFEVAPVKGGKPFVIGPGLQDMRSHGGDPRPDHAVAQDAGGTSNVENVQSNALAHGKDPLRDDAAPQDAGGNVKNANREDPPRDDADAQDAGGTSNDVLRQYVRCLRQRWAAITASPNCKTLEEYLADSYPRPQQ